MSTKINVIVSGFNTLLDRVTRLQASTRQEKVRPSERTTTEEEERTNVASGDPYKKKKKPENNRKQIAGGPFTLCLFAAYNTLPYATSEWYNPPNPGQIKLNNSVLSNDSSIYSSTRSWELTISDVTGYQGDLPISRDVEVEGVDADVTYWLDSQAPCQINWSNTPESKLQLQATEQNMALSGNRELDIGIAQLVLPALPLPDFSSLTSVYEVEVLYSDLWWDNLMPVVNVVSGSEPSVDDKRNYIFYDTDNEYYYRYNSSLSFKYQIEESPQVNLQKVNPATLAGESTEAIATWHRRQRGRQVNGFLNDPPVAGLPPWNFIFISGATTELLEAWYPSGTLIRVANFADYDSRARILRVIYVTTKLGSPCIRVEPILSESDLAEPVGSLGYVFYLPTPPIGDVGAELLSRARVIYHHESWAAVAEDDSTWIPLYQSTFKQSLNNLGLYAGITHPTDILLTLGSNPGSANIDVSSAFFRQHPDNNLIEYYDPEFGTKIRVPTRYYGDQESMLQEQEDIEDSYTIIGGSRYSIPSVTPGGRLTVGPDTSLESIKDQSYKSYFYAAEPKIELQSDDLLSFEALDQGLIAAGDDNPFPESLKEQQLDRHMRMVQRLSAQWGKEWGDDLPAGFELIFVDFKDDSSIFGSAWPLGFENAGYSNFDFKSAFMDSYPRDIVNGQTWNEPIAGDKQMNIWIRAYFKVSEIYNFENNLGGDVLIIEWVIRLNSSDLSELILKPAGNVFTNFSIPYQSDDYDRYDLDLRGYPVDMGFGVFG